MAQICSSIDHRRGDLIFNREPRNRRANIWCWRNVILNILSNRWFDIFFWFEKSIIILHFFDVILNIKWKYHQSTMAEPFCFHHIIYLRSTIPFPSIKAVIIQSRAVQMGKGKKKPRWISKYDTNHKIYHRIHDKSLIYFRNDCHRPEQHKSRYTESKNYYYWKRFFQWSSMMAIRPVYGIRHHFDRIHFQSYNCIARFKSFVY